MRYLLCLVICHLFLGCSSNDDGKSKPGSILADMEGKFRLVEMYTETAVDLNLDGLSGNDLFSEIPCTLYSSLDTYEIDVAYNNTYGDYAGISIDVPSSYVFPNSDPVSQCFIDANLTYLDIKANQETGELIISNRDYEENIYGELLQAMFIDDTFYLDFDVPLFTSEGWQTVRIHQTFERYSHN